ncbi:MAG: hypothetical protein ACLPQY_25040, partial [Streptosporangiaceae bacterium]
GTTPLDPPMPAEVRAVVPAARRGLRSRTRWAGNERLAVTRCGNRRQYRPLAGACGPGLAGPVTSASP